MLVQCWCNAGGTNAVPDDVRGEGEAADGEVRAVASRGRLRNVELAPRLMRSPVEESAAASVAAPEWRAVA